MYNQLQYYFPFYGIFSTIPQNFTIYIFPNSRKLYGIIILLHEGDINAWFHTKAMLHEAVSVVWFHSVTFVEKQEKISIVWLSHKQEVIRWDFSLILNTVFEPIMKLTFFLHNCEIFQWKNFYLWRLNWRGFIKHDLFLWQHYQVFMFLKHYILLQVRFHTFYNFLEIQKWGVKKQWIHESASWCGRNIKI